MRPPKLWGRGRPRLPSCCHTAPGSTPRAQLGPTLLQFPATPALRTSHPHPPWPRVSLEPDWVGAECPRPRLSQDEGLGCLSSDQRALSGQRSLPIPAASSPASQPNPPPPLPDASQAVQHSPDPQPRRALVSDKALTSLPKRVAGERPARSAVEGHGAGSLVHVVHPQGGQYSE